MSRNLYLVRYEDWTLDTVVMGQEVARGAAERLGTQSVVRIKDNGIELSEAHLNFMTVDMSRN